MKAIKFVDPFRCRMWDLHDRLESDVTEESCKEEIESFLKHGQLVPVLGRPLRGDPLYDIELIYGARRLFVARHLNKPLAIDLREVADREGIVAMDVENRQRKDVSPYERGRGYARWLRAGHFESQDDIARALNVSASQVSRLLKLSRLPSVLVNAFGSTVDICERWGLELIEMWEDPQKRHAIAQQARLIGAMSPRPAAQDVYRKLLTSVVRGRRPKEKRHDEIVMDDLGNPLFRIRHQGKSIAFLMPVEKISASCLRRLRQSISDVLHDASAQTLDQNEKVSRKLVHPEPMTSHNVRSVSNAWES
jgi:ParB family chromosome partitioning protein